VVSHVPGSGGSARSSWSHRAGSNALRAIDGSRDGGVLDDCHGWCDDLSFGQR
jgi:hypothetical protein